MSSAKRRFFIALAAGLCLAVQGSAGAQAVPTFADPTAGVPALLGYFQKTNPVSRPRATSWTGSLVGERQAAGRSDSLRSPQSHFFREFVAGIPGSIAGLALTAVGGEALSAGIGSGPHVLSWRNAESLALLLVHTGASFGASWLAWAVSGPPGARGSLARAFEGAFLTSISSFALLSQGKGMFAGREEYGGAALVVSVTLLPAFGAALGVESSKKKTERGNESPTFLAAGWNLSVLVDPRADASSGFSVQLSRRTGRKLGRWVVERGLRYAVQRSWLRRITVGWGEGELVDLFCRVHTLEVFWLGRFFLERSRTPRVSVVVGGGPFLPLLDFSESRRIRRLYTGDFEYSWPYEAPGLLSSSAGVNLEFGGGLSFGRVRLDVLLSYGFGRLDTLDGVADLDEHLLSVHFLLGYRYGG